MERQCCDNGVARRQIDIEKAGVHEGGAGAPGAKTLAREVEDRRVLIDHGQARVWARVKTLGSERAGSCAQVNDLRILALDRSQRGRRRLDHSLISRNERANPHVVLVQANVEMRRDAHAHIDYISRSGAHGRISPISREVECGTSGCWNARHKLSETRLLKAESRTMPADSIPLPPRPALVAPVSQYLGVIDAARSVAFYRDVLGFSVHDVLDDSGVSAVAEVAHGPARIQFGVDASGNASSRRVLFFETDDVAAMREAVAAHGGLPTALQDVNWIKVRMFEVRDPDGHTLWFGQPYGGPDVPRPQHQLRSIMPELPLDDVSAGVAYYRDVLGFEINYQQHDLGVMDRDDVRLLLIARTERHIGIGSCSLYVNAVDALHEELLAKGANVQGHPISHPWGLREFQVLDLEGNRLSFAQTFE